MKMIILLSTNVLQHSLCVFVLTFSYLEVVQIRDLPNIICKNTSNFISGDAVLYWNSCIVKKSSSNLLPGIFQVLEVTFVPSPVAKDQVMKVLD